MGPLADVQDVVDVWHPIPDAQLTQVENLIAKASAKLRQAAPYDVDARLAMFTEQPTNPQRLDPIVVADVVATVVKRFLVNVDGAFTYSHTVPGFTQSATFVNRYDKTGGSTHGALQVTDSDLEQLKQAAPMTPMPPIRILPGRSYPVPWRAGDGVRGSDDRDYPSVVESSPPYGPVYGGSGKNFRP